MKFFDVLSLGYDGYGVVEAVKENDGHQFSMAMLAFIGDVGKVGKIDELQENLNEFQPDIDSLFTKISARVNK